MKRIRIISFAILVALFLFTPTSYIMNGKVVVVQAATLTISSKTATIEVGQTKTLTISGTKKKATWSSSRKSIASVSGSGIITAKAVGTATITAYVDGKKLTCSVTVIPLIKISASSLSMETGETQVLRISGTTKVPVWTSSNKSVVTVSSKGTVTAVKDGTATITASISGKKLSCKVTVVPPATISLDSMTLEIGETQKLKISDTTKTPVWTSSDISVATVSSKGTVTAVKVGTATITASFAGKKLTSQITVITPVTLSSSSMALEAGTSQQIQLSGGASTTLWYSTQKYIAGVSIDGTVTAYKAGTAIIYAFVDGKALKCDVTVTNPDSISEGGMHIDLGDNTVAVSANGITDGVTFASSDPLVATIASNGYITPVSVGLTTVTASIDDKVYSYLITVTDPINPYIKDAPFTASELSFGKLGFVVPSDWHLDKETYSKEGYYMLQPNNTTESNTIISIYSTDESAPRYRAAKEEFRSYITEKELRDQLDAAFKDIGIAYKLSNFTQSDYQADFGKAFKTDYSLTVANEQAKQTIYLFCISKYIIQITVTDTGDINNFSNNVECILNSFILK